MTRPAHPVAEPDAGGRLVEALHLNQELIDHAADAFRHGRVDLASERGRDLRAAEAVHSASLGADGVDLLEEADGAAFAPGGLAEGLEERPDLAAGHSVPHALERRGGDEEVGDACLFGHRLGDVGLAGAGRALKQDAAARAATQLARELAVVEEDLEGVAHLSEHAAETLDVVEADVDLLGHEDRVR